MDDKLKKEFIKLIVQALDEVVMPAIDGLEQKMDQRFEKMDQRFDGVDSKLDRVIDNQIVSNNTLNDHEKRIKKLETKQTILSS